MAVGPGTINPQPLAIGVIGNPTKSYDGNNSATLTPSNYAILGLVSGEDMSVTETHGTYSSANAGTRTVTVNLDAGDMAPASNTLVSNYIIPSPVTGIGTIIRTDIDPGFIIATISAVHSFGAGRPGISAVVMTISISGASSRNFASCFSRNSGDEGAA